VDPIQGGEALDTFEEDGGGNDESWGWKTRCCTILGQHVQYVGGYLFQSSLPLAYDGQATPFRYLCRTMRCLVPRTTLFRQKIQQTGTKAARPGARDLGSRLGYLRIVKGFKNSKDAEFA